MTNNNCYLPHEAEIVERVIESPSIFTMRLRFVDDTTHNAYEFIPGQFNMVYLPGGGEVAISIVSDPESKDLYDHTIRIVGRVTKGLAQLKDGDRIGLRGPFGRGWPMEKAKKHNVIVITGGIGCAPTVSVIHYILNRRQDYGRLSILQGVKHTDDFFYRHRFETWRQAENTQVFLAANELGDHYENWHHGFVTDLLDQVDVDSEHTIAMMCGPEIMMLKSIEKLLQLGMSAENVYLTMERSMHCAVGHCGHCQFGGKFICKDGPVFSFPEVEALLKAKGV